MTRSRDVATQGGLVLISSTTIGTAVSSVVVNNAFSATYDNYRIILNSKSNAAYIALELKLGASTTGYAEMLLNASFSTGSMSNAYQSNGSRFLSAGGGTDSTTAYLNLDIMSPYDSAKYTRVMGGSGTASGSAGFLSAIHKVAASYTDFTITTDSSSITGGTIYVYGYKK